MYLGDSNSDAFANAGDFNRLRRNLRHAIPEAHLGGVRPRAIEDVKNTDLRRSLLPLFSGRV